MLASILPGIFPIVLSGLVLWVLGEGLQFASVVALTVSFGLGLSATIHFLNRLRHEERPYEDPAVAVERATVLVGPPLILTSIVLACGLIVTVFSGLPSLRLFGWLSAFAMILSACKEKSHFNRVQTETRRAAEKLEKVTRVLLAMLTARSEARSTLVSTYYDTATLALHCDLVDQIGDATNQDVAINRAGRVVPGWQERVLAERQNRKTCSSL